MELVEDFFLEEEASMMMLPRQNQSFELKACQFLNAQDFETLHVSVADFSFEGLNFSTKNSRTDFPVHLQKKKKEKNHVT